MWMIPAAIFIYFSIFFPTLPKYHGKIYHEENLELVVIQLDYTECIVRTPSYSGIHFIFIVILPSSRSWTCNNDRKDPLPIYMYKEGYVGAPHCEFRQWPKQRTNGSCHSVHACAFIQLNPSIILFFHLGVPRKPNRKSTETYQPASLNLSDNEGILL